MTVSNSQILDALLSEQNISRAAEKCHCSRSVIYSRLKQPEFSKRLQDAINERRRVADIYAARALESATTALLELVEAPGVADDVRLRAATAVIRSFKH